MRSAAKEVVNGAKEIVTGSEEEVVCHGCEGKGWIETKDGQVKTCPVCGGSGRIVEE
jgi:DnaJ-class molecular chaperone